MSPELEIVTPAEVVGIGFEPLDGSVGVERHRVVLIRNGTSFGHIDVELTREARHSDALKHVGGLRGLFLAVIRPKLHNQEYEGTIRLGIDHLKRIQTESVETTGSSRSKVAQTVEYFFEANPKGRISVELISNSTGINTPLIVNAMEYLEQLEVVRAERSSTSKYPTYRLERGGFTRLSTYLEESPDSAARNVEYFKSVTLPPEFDAPFAYVLMPFREDEFPQAWFSQVAKPLVKELFGINCLRADDAQNSNRVTNQIYTAIRRSRFAIAEVSTLNPNVLIEVGIALANQRALYPLCRDSERHVVTRVFDISDLPIRFYHDDVELRLRFEEIRRCGN